MRGNLFKIISGSGIIFLAVISAVFPVDAEEAVLIIDAGNETGEKPILQGFLYGFELSPLNFKASPDFIKLARELKPKFWRLGFENTFKNELAYNLIKTEFLPESEPKITFSGHIIIQKDVGCPVLLGPDCPAVLRNYPSGAKCFETRQELIAARKTALEEALKEIRAKNIVPEYFDIFNEPDLLWLLNKPDVERRVVLFEALKGECGVIRSYIPNAKIVAPSTSAYDRDLFFSLLKYISDNNLSVGAVSWHEFKDPQDIPAHVEDFRRMLASFPSLGMMEAHINEYSQAEEHLIPGWAVGWLYYLERSGVEWASRSCWYRAKGDSECGDGLDGLLTKDLKPQPLYWVYRRYADFDGLKRLRVSVPIVNLVALAGKNDSGSVIRILAGGYHAKYRQPKSAPIDVMVAVQNYPYPGPVTVEIEKIPDNNNAGALLEPVRVSAERMHSQNGTLFIPIAGYIEGDAYYIVINNPDNEKSG